MQLLKELNPQIRRIVVLCNPETTPTRASAFIREVEATTSTLAVQPVLAYVQNVFGIEPALAFFAAEPGGALLVMPDEFTLTYRHTIIGLASRLRLPAIYGTRFAAATGGLISYGPTEEGLHRGLATYIDRLLRGAKPSDLPVQAPTTYSLSVNLRTAKALGLSVSGTILAAADEVIE